MLSLIRGAVAAIATAGIVATLAGFLGHVHPLFDTMGAFRVQLAIGFVALFLFTVAFSALVARTLALVGLAIALFGLAPGVLPEDPVLSPDLRVYSQNLRYDNPMPEAVVAQIEAERADVVLLQEVSASNMVIPRTMRTRTEVICEFSGIGAIAILSRYPVMEEPVCARGQGAAWARLRTPDGPITVVNLHLPWPWPYGQAAQAEVVAELLRGLPEPILIGGDFNIPAWAHSVDRILEATGTRAVGGLRLTFQRPSFWPGLPLDHVLVSEDLQAQTDMLPRNGSDHHALITNLRFR
ncbi:endonuclease/exonuclease/phosphatase family protein [Oceanibium sediminis]|uniref:endonuclease/exonuclease/phosphatase family protein n=1 Tax=Oceanibium sediminis TaxID=2026339 RepID=UPI0018E5A5A9|nr:endonuclease/exonuclease/phosphatase family protein [Oceanibium sediminis]